MRVAIVMGSTSDLPKLEPAIDILKSFGVKVDVRCLSAHRAHAGLAAFIKEANSNGTEVFIAAAGMAAARPGAGAGLRLRFRRPGACPAAAAAGGQQQASNGRHCPYRRIQGPQAGGNHRQS